ncbi:MAG: hypothetical protein HYV45_03515 [Candidatus Moranbacteria bacterium]|nr:hypothetical protein [Candidatus Moranbacteria bacterium]
MKGFFERPILENREETERKYRLSVEEYFLGLKEFNVLVEEVEKMIIVSVTDRENILSKIKDPIIFVSNHPKIDRSLCIPADKIQNMKGGNIFGFDRFNYPIVRQLMLRNLLKRPFSTVSLDNGWREAMEDCWHTIITRGGSNRIIEIVKKHVTGQSLVIYPEGKSTAKTEMFSFHSGFLHLARLLDFKKIVLGISSPILSIGGENKMSVIDVAEIPHSDEDAQKFIEHIYEKIATELKMYG